MQDSVGWPSGNPLAGLAAGRLEQQLLDMSPVTLLYESL